MSPVISYPDPPPGSVYRPARDRLAPPRSNGPPNAPGAGRPARSEVATSAPFAPHDRRSPGPTRPGLWPEAGSLAPAARAADDPAGDDPAWARYLRYEVLLDVLVITPLTPHLDDDRALLGAIHRGLVALFQRPLPRRVVVHLFYITSLSTTGVALLVAHALRLAGAGGALRLSHVGPAVQATLDRVRLPRPLAVYPRVDDAVIALWGSCAGGRARTGAGGADRGDGIHAAPGRGHQT